MDRMIYTMMNTLDSSRRMHTISANNLANMNVPGFRRDLTNFEHSGRLTDQQSFEARLYQMETDRASFSNDSGFMDQTGHPFDVAIQDEGFFYVREGNGEPGLTRRGDLSTDVQGRLVNGANELMLNAAFEPIVVPPYRNIQITEVGQVIIEPIGGAEGEKIEVGLLATVVPAEDEQLTKTADALIRRKDGTLPEPNQLAHVRQGVLEGSNVNATEELINTIDIQRAFEMNMKMITTAKELDEASASLMRPPGE